MLTEDEIREVARLHDQVGELRPGYLHDGDACLEGPHTMPKFGKKSAKTPRRRSSTAVTARVTIAFEEDSKTKELRLIQK